MRHTSRLAWVPAVLAAVSVIVQGADTQPNPYHEAANWAQLPAGIEWGSVISADPDAQGYLWVFHRSEPPLLKFDASGKVAQSFGKGMFVQPHGLHIDRDGFIWATDAQGKDGKGHQVFKFSPDGRVLMTLGTAGEAGESPKTFNGPTDVAIAPNGDIFVTDGHGNNRVVKFSKNGTFLKAWGKKGSGQGEFNLPHSIAFDSSGRVFVADRENSRIQIFDQDGKFLAEWKQFGRPSGIFIAKDDTMYVADSESNATRNPGFKRGIRVGSAKDGKVTAFIPDTDPNPDASPSGAAEGVAADAQGNVYGARVRQKILIKYAKN
jgi:DNA-binding beta-propeller fold protein YncE